MTTFISTAILLISAAAGGYGEAGASTGMGGGATYGGQQWAPVTQADTDAFDHMGDLLRTLQVAQEGSSQARIMRTVFVVPGPDLTGEGIGQITEDLAVMCRIFDKATIWAGRMLPGQTATTIPIDVSGIDIPENRVRTQALYLDGHGAVFFLPVDFPLAAPPQEQAPTPKESSGDPVWSQTANELRGVPQATPRAAAPQYDAQKVENLKAALIGTLRHAANLRARRPNDVVTIVVTTRQNPAVGWGAVPLRGMDPYGSSYSQPQTTAPTSAGTPTVLILRTNKSDVDAVAKGGLSREQFAARVQLLMSWSAPAAEAGMGGFGVRGAGAGTSLQTR